MPRPRPLIQATVTPLNTEGDEAAPGWVRATLLLEQAAERRAARLASQEPAPDDRTAHDEKPRVSGGVTK